MIIAVVNAIYAIAYTRYPDFFRILHAIGWCYGVGHVVVRLGNSEFQLHVIFAEVEHEGILVWTSCYKLIHVLTL